MTMAGSLPQLEQIPPANPADIYAFHQIPEFALQYVTGDLGLAPPGQTGYDGQLPESLSSLEGWQLTEYLNRLSQYKSYVQHHLAIVDIDRMARKVALNGIKARIRISLRAESSRKLTNSDKDDIVNNSEEVQKAEFYYTLAEAKYALLRNLCDAAQMSWDTVSRNITERGQSMYNNRREHNISAIPLDPHNNNYRGPPKQQEKSIWKRPGKVT